MKKMIRKVASKYVDSLAESLAGDGSSPRKRKKIKSSPEMEKERSMIVNRLPGYFLIASILGIMYLFYTLIEPFFTTLLVAAVLTVLFYGIYRRLLKYLHGFSRLSSALMCFFIVCIIVVPLAGFVILLAREGIDMYETISEKIASGSLDFLFKWEQGGWFYDVKEQIKPVIDLDAVNLKEMVVGAAQNVSSFLVSQSALILKNLGAILIQFMIMLLSMFYLFKDGDMIIEKLTILSPMPKKYEDRIIARMDETIKAIAFGVFLTAIIQGTIAGIGYAIAGVSNPVFWGAATGLFSLIPMVGTAAIWFPAALITGLSGNIPGGVFLGLWGLFLVGTVDNLVRPYLIGGKSHMYPLLTFFVVLGGILTFGLKGLIFGPLILVLLMTLLHVYELEYKNVLEK